MDRSIRQRARLHRSVRRDSRIAYVRTSRRGQIYTAVYPKILNNYYPSCILTAPPGGNQAIAANTMYALPFPVEVTMTVDRIAVDCQTLDAAGHWRVGIYRDNGAGYPGALLIDAGAIDTAATGILFAAIAATTLYKGTLYWLAAVSDTNVAKIYVENAGYIHPGLFGGAATLHDFQGMVFVAQAYGALPNPFTAGAARQVWNFAMGVRVSSVP